MVKLDLPRGMRDLEPGDFASINYVKEKFLQTAEAFNFQIMEPTPVELLATMEAKSGAAISNETYSFMDKGDRKVALRFDLTIGLTRYVASRRDLKFPLKLASFAGVWRYDEPQAGRYRYFHQWDIEVYGPFSVESDAEVIAFVARFFQTLGLKVKIHVNDRRLLEEFIRTNLSASDEREIGEMFRAVDKLPKKGREAIIKEYEGKVQPDKLLDLLDICSHKGSAQDLLAGQPNISSLASWPFLTDLMASLNSRGVENVVIDLGVVRGLDYYSGTVFEVFDLADPGAGALVGGGRYDSLTSAFGRSEIGATGAAGGIERIVLSLQSKSLLPSQKKKLVYVASAAESARHTALEVASKLRGQNIATDYDMMKKNLRKQLEDASAKDADAVIILAESELQSGKFTLRNMKTGNESQHKLNDIVEAVRQSLNP
ncbi:MAG: histidine--tRNA ligase [Nitrososphaera sp.]